MLNWSQPKTGVSSIIYDLTKWDYNVGHSGINSLDITILKNNEEIADVSFSDEKLNVYRKRALTSVEESELELFIDDLMWEDEFSSFSHLSFVQTEYRNAEELARMIEEKYSDVLLYIRHNEQDAFMGYLEEVSIKKLNASEALFCYFTPIDDDAELIRTTVILRPDIKAVATANSLRVEGAGEKLEISRHVQHETQ